MNVRSVRSRRRWRVPAVQRSDVVDQAEVVRGIQLTRQRHHGHGRALDAFDRGLHGHRSLLLRTPDPRPRQGQYVATPGRARCTIRSVARRIRWMPMPPGLRCCGGTDRSGDETAVGSNAGAIILEGQDDVVADQLGGQLDRPRLAAVPVADDVGRGLVDRLDQVIDAICRRRRSSSTPAARSRATRRAARAWPGWSPAGGTASPRLSRLRRPCLGSTMLPSGSVV